MTSHDPGAAPFRHLEPLPHGAPLRLPAPSGTPLEAAAAAANLRRLDDAREVVSRWFPTGDRLLPPSEIVEIEATPLLDATNLDGLVDELLVFDDERPPRLRVGAPPGLEADAEIPFRTTYELYRPDVGTLFASAVRGSALLLSSVERHDPRLVDLVRSLETILGPTAGVDLVVSEAAAALDLGRLEETALLVVPVRGSLDVAGHGVSPGRAVALPERSDVVLHCVERSLVLLLWLPVWSVRRTVANAAMAVRRHPLLRADFPIDPAVPVHSYGGSFLDEPGRYQELLAEVITPDEIGRAVATLRASARPHLESTFETAAAALVRLPSTMRVCATGGVMVIDHERSVAPVVSGVRLDAAPEVLLAVTEGADGRPFDTASMPRLSGADPGPLLAEMIVAGLAEATA